ncbi:DUF2239 family protein [Janthinobacterium agaricidamnosum]|uniref:DUF2239 family protein n=1 Tax=Janthinobacterium agaricidamnosum NBRC 102515 = DSM 9628 TaxID=1349767 RepID=W0VA74_9BURK|nr:DUF2239 family protein [Janthinobacterium agaricidamnosum]CDG84258.1 putative uncharacterized protein [Janthinobacterium agaricidamnosum NBRC 102515 = DSM 9628]
MSSNKLSAFAGHDKVASGDLRSIAVDLKAIIEHDPLAQILIFDDMTGAQLDLNLHGTLEQVLQRLPRPPVEMATPRTAGRPRLGVVAREVTLLPRHWEWLAGQPGGASVALRKLVEHAQRDNREADQQRQARDAAYRFISAMAGNQAGFEEACRALFAAKREQFAACIANWPSDIRQQALRMAAPSFGAAG